MRHSQRGFIKTEGRNWEERGSHRAFSGHREKEIRKEQSSFGERKKNVRGRQHSTEGGRVQHSNEQEAIYFRDAVGQFSGFH
jgi:hypothetical protein